jgi:hypothetical protein
VSYDDEELFDHQVTAWTVGQLRAALDGLPDDVPVRVIPADEPGSDVAGDDQVVISAAPVGGRRRRSYGLSRVHLHPGRYR